MYYKVTQKCDIVPQKESFTTKCNILPQVIFINNPTTICGILLQNIVIYHKMLYYTMNSSTSTPKVVFYHIMQ